MKIKLTDRLLMIIIILVLCILCFSIFTLARNGVMCIKDPLAFHLEQKKPQLQGELDSANCLCSITEGGVTATESYSLYDGKITKNN